MRDTKSDYWRFLLMGLAFSAMGLFNIVDGITTGYRVLTWQKTLGTITFSSLNPCRISGKSGGTGSSLVIGYSYLVNNATYASNRIAPSGYSECLRDYDAQAVISKFPVNAKVLVRFKPEQPNDAFVFGGKIGHWYDFVLLIGGVLCICLAPYASSNISFTRNRN